jgi:Domain of unknown function (DUF4287)
MSFQAYLDNIKAKTGKGPEGFKKLATKKGFLENGKLKPAVKAGEIVAWLYLHSFHAWYKEVHDQPCNNIGSATNNKYDQVPCLNMTQRFIIVK